MIAATGATPLPLFEIHHLCSSDNDMAVHAMRHAQVVHL